MGKEISVVAADGKCLITLEEVEKRAIMHALAFHRGNKLIVAQQLGISRMTLYRHMDRMGIARDYGHETSSVAPLAQ